MGGGEELTRKIFRSILTVGVAVLACSLLLVMGCFYSFYEGMQEHQLGDELRIAAAAVETNGSTYLEKIKSDRFRVTWIASDGTVKGMARFVFDWCAQQIDYLRIDTHENNRPMQAAVLRYGFQPCGIVQVRGGARLAFDYEVRA